jgi:adenylate kinase family enzyme
MDKKTVIFIGRSGCGKGTQATLLKDYIEKNSKDNKVFYLETGAQFREFIQEDGFTSELANEIYKNGGRQPDFLAVHIWSHSFIKSLSGDKSIIIDGTPRSIIEAEVLDTAIKFYNREKTAVIYLNVSKELSLDRLHGRGRIDDKSDKIIERRFKWFEEDVLPAIEYYRNNKDYNFFEIDGEKPVGDIFKEIVDSI